MHYTRKMWGARKRKHAPGLLNPKEVVGFLLHYPGQEGRVTTARDARANLRSIQAYHMDTRGWSDIAYNIAFDQRGNTYGLRGIRKRSAANGNEDLNGMFPAYLLLIANDETPSPKMIKAINKRLKRDRRLFPKAISVDGHNAVRSTSCPGEATLHLIRKGVIK